MLVKSYFFFLLSWSAYTLSLPPDRQSATVLAASPPPQTSETLNYTPPTSPGKPINEDQCFPPPQGREYRLPTNRRDCFRAADLLARLGDWATPLIFSRTPGADVKLPVDVRVGSCYIYLNVLNQGDQDLLTLPDVAAAADEIAVRCTTGTYKYGGRGFVGPRAVVYLIVGGCLPTDAGLPPATDSPLLTSRDQTESRVPDTSMISPRDLAGPLVSKSLPTSENSSLNILGTTPNGSTVSDSPLPEFKPDCFEPGSVPGIRSWPINFVDCSQAVREFMGNRRSADNYTFTRDPGLGEFYYNLPVTFKHLSCVLFVDIQDEDVTVTVRLAYVLGTVNFLVYTCGGGRSRYHAYGGWANVGGGPHHSVRIWLYGREPVPLQPAAANGNTQEPTSLPLEAASQ